MKNPAKINLRNKALQFLARREYARAELQQKLTPYTEDPSEIEPLLDDFTQRGWLSDARFAEQWTHQRSSRYGSARIKQELRQKGVADEMIEHAVEILDESEFDRAHQVWQRRFSSPPSDLKEKTRQLRFLASRGFSLDIIYRVVGGEMPDHAFFDDSLI